MTATETLTVETPKPTATTRPIENGVHTKSVEAEPEPKVIRKIGLVEGYFHAEIERNASINAATILFRSQLDLFTNIELVKRAIRLWKRTQPFLRARVVKNPANPSECYFAHVDDDQEKEDSLKNVSFLYVGRGERGEKSACREEYWKMLIEREVTIPIDWKDGPMWRLMFVELNKNLDGDKTNGASVKNGDTVCLSIYLQIYFRALQKRIMIQIC